MNRNFSGLGVIAMAVLVSLWSRELHAAEGDSAGGRSTNELTIAALVEETLAHNPELNFYLAEITAARGERKSAGRWANPDVSGGVGQKRTTGAGLSGEGAAWSVSVLQPFEWPGRLGLRKAIANRDIDLAELGYERFRAALAARVRMLAYLRFAAQEKAAAAREVADRFRELRTVLVQRDPAGLTPLLETRVIEATEINMQRRAGEAELANSTALMELNQLRGVAPETQFVVVPPDFSFQPATNREVVLALACTNNFEVRSRAIELAQQGFKVELAKNERYPAISIGPTVSVENADDRERIIGLAISLPVPIWNRNTGRIETARARQTQAETSFYLTQRDVERRALEAALTYEKKLSEMDQWRSDSIRHFREAAEVADRHFRLGAVPISTFVEVQKQYFEAVESLLNTKREALDAAQNLELLTGLTPPLVHTEVKK